MKILPITASLTHKLLCLLMATFSRKFWREQYTYTAQGATQNFAVCQPGIAVEPVGLKIPPLLFLYSAGKRKAQWWSPGVLQYAVFHLISQHGTVNYTQAYIQLTVCPV